MIAKIILNTVINLITKQITKVLGDKITIQSIMKLCFLGAGVMFFVLGFDLPTIAAVLIIIIGMGGYYIYFKDGKTNMLPQMSTSPQNTKNFVLLDPNFWSENSNTINKLWDEMKSNIKNSTESNWIKQLENILTNGDLSPHMEMEQF